MIKSFVFAAVLALARVAGAVPADVAPTGTLRAAFLGSNPVQGHVDPATGEVTGVVADLVKDEQIAAMSAGKLRALPDNFLVVQQAIVTPIAEPARLAELQKFVADVRDNGFVRDALARTRIAGLAVAGVAPPKPGPFTLASSFRDGGMLALKNAGNAKANPNCVGTNVSPPLSWSNPPSGTRSLALTMIDPEGRGGLGVVHWVAYGIPSTVGGLQENEASAPSTKFVGGKGTAGLGTYTGPCTPPGSGLHHYTFTLIATDLDPAQFEPGLTHAELMAKLEGHAKGATGLVGLFGRP